MNNRKTLVWVSLYAIAMGFLESAVVIYLRELYYKDGFDFPLKPISPFIGRVEYYREVATVVMLIACGILAGRSKLQRFAYFVLAFAIWDLFYYVFLYLFLAWPQSLATWDILFLIPFPWVGPVWAPCLLSLLMTFGAVFVIHRTNHDRTYKLSLTAWLPLISGAVICIVSFMWDYLMYTSGHNNWGPVSEEALFKEIETYVPVSFNTPLFFTGFLLMLLPVVFSVYSSFKIKTK